MRRASLLWMLGWGALIVLMISNASEVDALTPTAAPVPPAPVQIQTVPALAGVRFAVDGRIITSDESGLATIQLDKGTYQIELLDSSFEAPGVQAQFSRWVDSVFTPRRDLVVRANTKMEAGFDVYHPVKMHFVDLSGNPVATEKVTSLTMTNSTGGKDSYESWEPKWILASHIARRAFGLGAVDIRYQIDSVVVDGTNVVNRSQLRFIPTQSRDWQIQLLFYSAHFEARDAFFGFPIGSGIELVYPDGHAEQHSFESASQINLASLPRGDYKVKVNGPGLSFSRPVSVSTNQEVTLPVISYLDLGLLFVVLWLLITVLLWIGRPHLFQVLRRRRKRLTVESDVTHSEHGW